MSNIQIKNTKSELHTHLMGMLSAPEFLKLLSNYSNTIYYPMDNVENENSEIISLKDLLDKDSMHAVRSVSIPNGEKLDYESGLENLYRNRTELLAYAIKQYANVSAKTEEKARDYIYNDYFNRSIAELVNNGITYAEISYSNENLINVFHLNENLKGKINYTFLLCQQRSREVKPNMMNKIKKAYDSGIAIGFDFMGMETPLSDGELKDTGRSSYKIKLERVLEVLINCPSSVLRFHSGESRGTEGNTEKIFHIIDKIKTEKGYSDFPPPQLRIGHGIHYNKSEYYYEFMKKNHVIVEINASSNLALSNIDSINELPYIDYLDHEIPIVISTDGHGLYCTTTLIEDKIAYYNYRENSKEEAYDNLLKQEEEIIRGKK